jgi:hypothetical protein
MKHRDVGVCREHPNWIPSISAGLTRSGYPGFLPRRPNKKG